MPHTSPVQFLCWTQSDTGMVWFLSQTQDLLDTGWFLDSVWEKKKKSSNEV